MIKFIKIDEETYEVRVTTGDESTWKLAGVLVKAKDGLWTFEYDGQGIKYEDSLEETEVDLAQEFDDGKTDHMSYYFGNYRYNK